MFYTLTTLHKYNVILRDIKPANLMTDVNLKQVNATNKPPISLYFIDFGLAEIGQKDTGNLAGTLAFVHP